MSVLPSTKGRRSLSRQESEQNVALAPVTLGEQSLFVLAIIRIFVGLLWFQQLFWKLPPSFAGLRVYLTREVKLTFVPGYAYIIQHVFIPNFILLAACVWLAEFVVSLCLFFGVFSRFGGLLSTILALQLYVGLSNGEWYWTYGMLVLLGGIFAVVPAGRRLGVDEWLAPRIQGMQGRAGRVLAWLV